MANEIPIPQPPTHLFLGNLPDLDSSHMLATYMNMTKQYGPIFALDMVRARTIYCGSQALVNEICDDTRFEKLVAGPLAQVRNMAGSGLFSANSWEHDWKLAHKLLIPAFGPLAIKQMFPQMTDIAGQMLIKWQRFGPEHAIDVSDAFTRLTLDTIALCAFDYRFNSFYQDEMHPFVTRALDALLESGRRAGRTDLETRIRKWSRDKYDSDIAYCWKVCDEIVADRKAHPREVNDLLNVMLRAEDPETGEKMSDELIRYEM